MKPITNTQIRSLVQAKYDAMSDCYFDGWRRDNTLSGEVELSFSLDGDGRVVGLSTPRKPARRGPKRITDPQVLECIEDIVRKIEFPPTGRGLVPVIYPLSFQMG